MMDARDPNRPVPDALRGGGAGVCGLTAEVVPCRGVCAATAERP